MPIHPTHEQLMHGMHDTFWRNDQIMVVFYSTESLIAGGKNNASNVFKFQELQSHVDGLNDFLKGVIDQQQLPPFHLDFLGGRMASTTMSAAPHMHGSDDDKDVHLPDGIYLFGLEKPITRFFKEEKALQTVIPAFLQIVPDPPAQSDAMDAHSNDTGYMIESGPTGEPLIPFLINSLNDYITKLNTPPSSDARAQPNGGAMSTQTTDIGFVTPHWFTGATYGIGQGCPLTPPLPVEGEVSNWHIELPELDNLSDSSPYSDIATMKGKGTKIFILDSLPERGVISRAAHDSWAENPLLHLVDETVKFNYDLMSGIQAQDVMANTDNTSVGKDIYGQHYRALLADHGLFIAGMVRDIARDADVECIRVLDDLCVGEVKTIIDALWKIYNRTLTVKTDPNEKEDLQNTPVVINLSLVIPTTDQAKGQGVKTAITSGIPGSGSVNMLAESMKHILQSLSDQGVVIVASAGNEGDDRHMHTMPGMAATSAHPPALFPASLSDEIANLISVGALTSGGQVAQYSCYPGGKSISTWGGRVPGSTAEGEATSEEVIPSSPDKPGSDNPTINVYDAPIGIYSSPDFPPKSANLPAQYYTAPTPNCWAYWVGTSFAAPIVSAAAARAAQWKKHTGSTDSIYKLLTQLTGGGEAKWKELDPHATISGIQADGTAQTPMLQARQPHS